MLSTISPQDIYKTFAPAYLESGRTYFRDGKVTLIEIQKTGNQIAGAVVGSGRNVYRVYIRLQAQPRGGTRVEGECGCPAGFNCRHVAALLLKAHSPSLSSAPPIAAQQRIIPPPTPRFITTRGGTRRGSQSAPLMAGDLTLLFEPLIGWARLHRAHAGVYFQGFYREPENGCRFSRNSFCG